MANPAFVTGTRNGTQLALNDGNRARPPSWQAGEELTKWTGGPSSLPLAIFWKLVTE
jgi:hypothetical protein